jgi:hypothetical protein
MEFLFLIRFGFLIFPPIKKTAFRVKGGFPRLPTLHPLFFPPDLFFIEGGGPPHILDGLKNMGPGCVLIREADQILRFQVRVQP